MASRTRESYPPAGAIVCFHWFILADESGPVGAQLDQSTFLRNWLPWVSLTFPPVGWQSTVPHLGHTTAVWEWEKSWLMWPQLGHLTSRK